MPFRQSSWRSDKGGELLPVLSFGENVCEVRIYARFHVDLVFFRGFRIWVLLEEAGNGLFVLFCCIWWVSGTGIWKGSLRILKFERFMVDNRCISCNFSIVWSFIADFDFFVFNDWDGLTYFVVVSVYNQWSSISNSLMLLGWLGFRWVRLRWC